MLIKKLINVILWGILSVASGCGSDEPETSSSTEDQNPIITAPSGGGADTAASDPSEPADPESSDEPSTQTASDAPSGQALYEANCSGCHGPFASSEKAGRSASDIKAAILSIPDMAQLSSLSDEQIDYIAADLTSSILY